MKHSLWMFALALILTTASFAATSADSVLPETTTPDMTQVEENVVEPLEELLPELDTENTSAQACNDYCYDQAQTCLSNCGGNQACEDQCYAEEFQCNCDCGAIPFCP